MTAFSISGPGVDRTAPDLGPAISGATTYACRATSPATYYVRRGDEIVVRVERDENGCVTAATVRGEAGA